MWKYVEIFQKMAKCEARVWGSQWKKLKNESGGRIAGIADVQSNKENVKEM